MTTRTAPYSPTGPRLVVTDGGVHPADVWASVSAEHIVPVTESLTGALRSSALRAQGQIAEALTPHYRSAQQDEVSALSDPKRLVAELDPGCGIDAAVAALTDSLRGVGEWEGRVAAEIDKVRQELEIHFRSARLIERSWHADRTPDHPLLSLWKVQRHPGPILLTMAGYTTAMPYSFKNELAEGLQNFTTSTGNVFKIALGIQSPTGTYGGATTNYSNLTGNSDEVPNGSGYTTGGFAWTAAENITPLNTTSQTYWQMNTNPSWSSATFSFAGCLIYNSTNGNRAAYVGSLGNQSVTAGTVTLIFPTNSAGTSLWQLN